MTPDTPRQYILMLEDDPDDRFITQTVFEDNNYDVEIRFLDHGRSVLNHLDHCRRNELPLPALIILDKNVPGKGGMEVLRELKSHREYRRLPVVLISGSAHDSEVDEAYAVGANSFIVKPANDRLTQERIDSFVRYWFGIVELSS